MTNDQIKEVKMAWARGEVVQYNAGYGWYDWQETDRLTIRKRHQISVVWRVKPRTIRIGEYDVPEPLREVKIDNYYWVISPADKDTCYRFKFRGAPWEEGWVDRGLCHATKEAAEIHAKALLSFTDGSKR